MIPQLCDDAEQIERVMNDPFTARPLGFEPGTWSWASAREKGARAWAFPDGIFLVVPEKPHEAQVHVAVLPEGRGASAVDAAKFALRAEIAQDSRLRLYGRTPFRFRHALMFAVSCGMRLVGEKDGEWITEATSETHGR